MATIYKGNAQTAKTLGINLKAKVTNVFAAGFNCSTNIDSKEIKTFSTFSMLGKEGRNILTQADIIVGKEVMVTKLLENLTPGKDPIATGIVGIPVVTAPKTPDHYDDLEEEFDDDSSYGSSYSRHHGNGGGKKRYDKRDNGDGNRRRQTKVKGGGNSRRFLDDIDEEDL